MKGLWELDIDLKTREDMRGIARATRLAAAALEHAGRAVRPGTALSEIGERARACAHGQGAECVRVFTSVNATAAHGVPDGTLLRDGDLLTLDVSLRLDGWWGDVAWSFVVGKSTPAARWLLSAARETAWEAAAAVRCGARLSDVSDAARRAAMRYGCALAEGSAGHGIGRDLHEAPTHDYGETAVEGYLVPGMVLTVEPIISLGGPALVGTPGVAGVTAADGSLTAQFEHTVAVVADGALLLDPLPTPGAAPRCSS